MASAAATVSVNKLTFTSTITVRVSSFSVEVPLSIDPCNSNQLADGNKIPVLGFGKPRLVYSSLYVVQGQIYYDLGTYELDGKESYQAVRWALEVIRDLRSQCKHEPSLDSLRLDTA